MSEEKGSDARWTVALVGGIVLFSVGIPAFGEEVWPRIHGATAADLARLPLSGSPKELGRVAPASDVSSSSVRIQMKVGHGEYERADIDWPSDDLSAPNSMRLRPEHGAHQPDVAATLGRWLPLHGGRYTWGPVSFRVDDTDGDVRFTIDRTLDDHPNASFDKQVEAAREVLLNAAFGLPVTLSDAELADTLGTGYPVAAVGRSNVFVMPIEQGAAFVASHYPSATRSGSAGFAIPLAHPLLRAVKVEWNNERGGLIESVGLQTTDAYANGVDTFATCLGRKLGAPTTQVTDYFAGKHDSVFHVGAVTLSLGPRISVGLRGATSSADWAALFDAFDACHESAESGARSRAR